MTRGSLRHSFAGIVGNCPALLQALTRADLAAPTGYPILILGETGTGKTAIAQAIHDASNRTGQFVALNCAALTPTLVESQLFGYLRGAFTGAERDTPGLFEAADGGTLFLDEIGDLAMDAQAKLLRAIEQGLIRRLGSEREVSVDVRLIGATHQPLEERIARQLFREDLYYRINAFIIDLPPLRDRGTDIDELAQMFLDGSAGDREVRFDPAVLDRLRRYRWPGNLRELQSVVRQALVASHNAPLITLDHLPALQDRPPAANTASTSGTDLPAMTQQLPPAAPVHDRAQLPDATTALRLALGGDRRDLGRWARFFLSFAERLGSDSFSRRDVLTILREVRGPDAGKYALVHEWEEGLRQTIVETGLLAATGKKLQVDIARCRQQLATEAGAADTLPAHLTPPAATAPAQPAPATAGAPPGATAPVPAAPEIPVGRTAGNLPRQSAPLVGRDPELAELKRLLLDESASLVTVCGPGGIGKTTVALEAARALQPDAPGGCWFVDLTEARTGDDVVHGVMGALGLDSQLAEDPARAVGAALATRPGLTVLLLDNFEQVVEAARSTIGRWRDSAPDLRVLVTSRLMLGLAREVRLELEPLSSPSGSDQPSTAPAPDELLQFDSVRLFVERGADLRPGFALDEHNAEPVARICAQLGGIPLALELAAARLKLMAPAQIAERLGRKFELLRSTRQDLHPHQRTLRHTLEWSFNLLAGPEQQAFVRMCVFRGGFTLEAAEAVLAPLPDDVAVVDALDSLVEKSLVRSRTEGGMPRFHVYGVMREYGESLQTEMLGTDELDALEERHAGFYVEMAERCRLASRGDGDAHYAAGREMTADVENLHAARRRVMARDDWQRGSEICSSMAVLVADGLDRATLFSDFVRLLEIVPEDQLGLRLRVAAIYGEEAGEVSGLAHPAALELESLISRLRALLEDDGLSDDDRDHYRGLLAIALRNLSAVALAVGTAGPEQEAMLDEAVELMQDWGTSIERTATLRDRGRLLRGVGRMKEAMADLDVAEELSRRACRWSAVRDVRVSRAMILHAEGRRDEADALLLESERLGDDASAAELGRARTTRARFRCEAGIYDEAIELARAAIEFCRRAGALEQLAYSYLVYGMSLRHSRPHDAIDALQLAEDVWESMSSHRMSIAATIYRALTLAELDRPAEAEAVLAPSANKEWGILPEFLINAVLARVYTGLRQPDAARPHIEAARAMQERVGQYTGMHARELAALSEWLDAQV